MARATARGVGINYEIIGRVGPWVALAPGGRRRMEAVELLGHRVASVGYRVLIYDRRNCGASDVVIDGAAPAYEYWAEDLYGLLQRLRALPAVIGGASEGDLRSIAVPTIGVPGCDRIHGIAAGRNAQSLIPGVELFTEKADVDFYPLEEWDAREDELARAFNDFLGRAAT